MGRSVDQVGDPVPRSVFHCMLKKPTVIFVTGEGMIGKTSLASQITDGVRISTDQLFSPWRASPKHFIHPVQENYDKAKRNGNTTSFKMAWDAVKEDPAAREFFVDILVRAIKMCGAPLVVVEGYMLTEIVDRVKERLGDTYRCWISGRL
jgi:hypothetical protein